MDFNNQNRALFRAFTADPLNTAPNPGNTTPSPGKPLQTLAKPLQTLVKPLQTLGNPPQPLGQPLQTLGKPLQTLGVSGPWNTALTLLKSIQFYASSLFAISGLITVNIEFV